MLPPPIYMQQRSHLCQPVIVLFNYLSNLIEACSYHYKLNEGYDTGRKCSIGNIGVDFRVLEKITDGAPRFN